MKKITQYLKKYDGLEQDYDSNSQRKQLEFKKSSLFHQ